MKMIKYYDPKFKHFRNVLKTMHLIFDDAFMRQLQIISKTRNIQYN